MRVRTATCLATAAALVAGLGGCATESGSDGSGGGEVVVAAPAPVPSATGPDVPRKPLRPVPPERQGLPTRDGEARLPDQSAEDWVTYADHVVAATVVGERDGGPSPEQLEIGEGMYGREVTLRVDDILWSRPDPRQPAPTWFDWSAWGWIFNDHRPDLRRPFSNGDSPRMELGHSYVIALDWEEARCSPGDEKQPAQWNGLGSDAIVPFDDGVLGDGDMGGFRQDAAAAKANLAGRPYPSLRNKMLTLGAADLSAALAAAKPGERRDSDYGRPSPCSKD